jgi:hypothetical protein
VRLREKGGKRHAMPCHNLEEYRGVARQAGYEDMNDAERLCYDPTIRWVVGDRAAPAEHATRDLLLPRPLRGAMLTPKLPESGERR